MITDFYTTLDENPNFLYDEFEVNDKFYIFLQQVEMLMTSSKEDLLGDHEFGIGLEKYVWSQVVGSGAIETEIKNQIDKYTGNTDIDYDIEVSFVKQEIFDLLIVDLIIDGKKIAGYSIRP